jgi:simple sugar transport system permease protein
MRANQVVSGLAITMFGTGHGELSGRAARPATNNYNLAGMNLPTRFENLTIPGLSRIPILGALFNVTLLTYFLYLLLAAGHVLHVQDEVWDVAARRRGKSPHRRGDGNLRPQGTVPVHHLGWGARRTGRSVSVTGVHPQLEQQHDRGKGWIVIALVIFSGWNPAKVAIGTLVFGGITSLQFSLQAAGFKMVIPTQFLAIAPYFITIVVLAAMTIINQ